MVPDAFSGRKVGGVSGVGGFDYLPIHVRLAQCKHMLEEVESSSRLWEKLEP